MPPSGMGLNQKKNLVPGMNLSILVKISRVVEKFGTEMLMELQIIVTASAGGRTTPSYHCS